MDAFFPVVATIPAEEKVESKEDSATFMHNLTLNLMTNRRHRPSAGSRAELRQIEIDARIAKLRGYSERIIELATEFMDALVLPPDPHARKSDALVAFESFVDKAIMHIDFIEETESEHTDAS